MRRLVALMLVLALGALLPPGCDLWDPDKNPAWGNLTCNHGADGAWWACNLSQRLRDDHFPQATNGCGLMGCAFTEAEALAGAEQTLGRKDPGLQCLKQGNNGDNAASLPGFPPQWIVCLDKEPAPQPCATAGEPCDSPLYPNPDNLQCCPGLVCDVEYLDSTDAFCCADFGAACKATNECCAPSTGCVDGRCACAEAGAPCVDHPNQTSICCSGECQDGKCCVEQAGLCESDSDCCDGLTCSLNVCD